MAFCAEPVFASLANVLGNWENLPSPVSPDIKDYKLYDVETKYGLLQVCIFIYHMEKINFFKIIFGYLKLISHINYFI